MQKWKLQAAEAEAGASVRPSEGLAFLGVLLTLFIWFVD